MLSSELVENNLKSNWKEYKQAAESGWLELQGTTISRKQKVARTMHTASSIEKPFVHRIIFPELIEVCITGNEKVKPSSLCLPGG